MRRRLAALIVSVLALGLAFASPWSATANPCDARTIVMTGHRAVGAYYDPTNIGCTANQTTTMRILPGADAMIVRVLQPDSKAPVPVAAVFTTDSKTAEFEMKSDAADPRKAKKHESTELSIGSTSKVLVKVTFDDGSAEELTYTR
jgi:hypothetical protein